jgi:hypothetical protein
MKQLFILIFFVTPSTILYSQGCCSGGSASPIAGGTSQGVLNLNQLEIAPNFQFMQSNRFLVQNIDTTPPIKNLSSNYLYLRLAYGISKKLTMSIESGYYLQRRQIGLEASDTIQTSGIADLIIFPRYEVYQKNTSKKRVEAVIGLGMKIPLGSHEDSTIFYSDPFTGKDYYQIAPPNVQPTNGSNDFIFYGFFLHKYLKRNIRLFANTVYVRKGWNSLGQKYGDYGSISLFGSKTFYNKIGLTIELKAERIGQMQTDKMVDMVALYNIYPTSTGSRKLFIAPQISYTFQSLTVYGLTEIPLYQYVEGSQIASQFQFTGGISYKISCCKEATLLDD